MKKILHNYPPMKMEQTECSETLAYESQRRKHTTSDIKFQVPELDLQPIG
jgi:hypothetical protein